MKRHKHAVQKSCARAAFFYRQLDVLKHESIRVRIKSALIRPISIHDAGTYCLVSHFLIFT
ncbi:MAG: hypothetical protein A2176_08925 [Spirochaetes bacterium RBG_13_51_14]|nr:MAG: hypothetical protein A2176_08925 [Spirochaetes bacterium RBG_13_51_14]